MRGASDAPPIEIKATVQPAQSMTVVAQVDGQVQSVAVREGAKIAANQEVAQLTNPSVERDAALASAQLEWLESRRNTPPRAEPARPRDSLEIAEKILALKQQRYETMKQLRRSSDITARELEQAEVEVLAAQRDVNNERRAAVSAPAATGDRRLLEIERQKNIAEQKFAAQRQSLLRIASPIAGIVTKLYVAPGQAVFPRDPIADVSDVATLLVRGDVAPELVRYLRPGMRVDVRVFSVPPRSFAADIDHIVPMQGAGSTSRQATVVVSIPNPDGSLQPNTEALITLRSLR